MAARMRKLTETEVESVYSALTGSHGDVRLSVNEKCGYLAVYGAVRKALGIAEGQPTPPEIVYLVEKRQAPADLRTQVLIDAATARLTVEARNLLERYDTALDLVREFGDKVKVSEDAAKTTDGELVDARFALYGLEILAEDRDHELEILFGDFAETDRERAIQMARADEQEAAKNAALEAQDRQTERASALTKEVARLTTELAGTGPRIKTAESAKTAAERKAETAERAKSDLKAQYEASRRERDELETARTALQEEINQARTKLSGYPSDDPSAVVLRSELAAAQKLQEAADAAKSELEKDLAGVRSDLEAERKRPGIPTDYEAIKRKAETDLPAVERERDAKEAARSQLEIELAAERAKPREPTDYAELKRKAEEDLPKTEQERAQLATRVVELTRELSVAPTTAEMDRIKTELRDLRLRHDALEAERNEYRNTTVPTLRIDLTTARRERDEERAKAAKVGGYETRIRELETDLDAERKRPAASPVDLSQYIERSEYKKLEEELAKRPDEATLTAKILADLTADVDRQLQADKL